MFLKMYATGFPPASHLMSLPSFVRPHTGVRGRQEAHDGVQDEGAAHVVHGRGAQHREELGGADAGGEAGAELILA